MSFESLWFFSSNAGFRKGNRTQKPSHAWQLFHHQLSWCSVVSRRSFIKRLEFEEPGVQRGGIPGEGWTGRLGCGRGWIWKVRATLYRTRRTNAEGNAGRQGAMLCRNPPHVLLIPYSLYRQLEICVAVHRVQHKHIKTRSWLIRNILKLLTSKIWGSGKAESSPTLLVLFDSLLIL